MLPSEAIVSLAYQILRQGLGSVLLREPPYTIILHKNDMVWSSWQPDLALVAIQHLRDGKAKTMGNPLLLPKCTLYVHAEGQLCDFKAACLWMKEALRSSFVPKVRIVKMGIRKWIWLKTLGKYLLLKEKGSWKPNMKTITSGHWRNSHMQYILDKLYSLSYKYLVSVLLNRCDHVNYKSKVATVVILPLTLCSWGSRYIIFIGKYCSSGRAIFWHAPNRRSVSRVAHSIPIT